jgi:hypothetical protein
MIRRLTVACGLAFLSLATPLARADLLTPDETRRGAEALAWAMKTTCGTTEAGVTRYGMWEGKLYSRVPGEKDRLLFQVFGINVRQCGRVEDPTRGAGFRSVSREVMYYLDPSTGEILDRWTNPWTGETVDVLHVANDPVNMARPTFERDERGQPLVRTLRRYGDLLVASNEVPLFYTNPLAGEYQDYVGGRYHAMEIFNTFYPAADLLDPKRTRIGESRLTWQRISGFTPWMKMADRPGLLVFNATGFSTFDRERIPTRLQALMTARHPDYFVPPPVDDPRPNETTWTVSKKVIDAQRAKAQ